MRAGRKRERLSSRFWIVLQASITRISTKGSANVPPKFSHSPSGSVRNRELPGIFRNGLLIRFHLLTDDRGARPPFPGAVSRLAGAGPIV